MRRPRSERPDRRDIFANVVRQEELIVITNAGGSPKRGTILPCVVLVLAAGAAATAQERGSSFGEWRYIGGDAGHTRYSPLNQIDAGNFKDLEQAWLWRGDNFGPTVDFLFR
ncbi:MAG TPA: hypothetical protein VLK65_00865, partial [Vicinamibacteria bacterium]|nr:hypothetical protein [Vicinamibacteria bacterium]